MCIHSSFFVLYANILIESSHFFYKQIRQVIYPLTNHIKSRKIFNSPSLLSNLWLTNFATYHSLVDEQQEVNERILLKIETSNDLKSKYSILSFIGLRRLSLSLLNTHVVQLYHHIIAMIY